MITRLLGLLLFVTATCGLSHVVSNGPLSTSSSSRSLPAAGCSFASYLFTHLTPPNRRRRRKRYTHNIYTCAYSLTHPKGVPLVVARKMQQGPLLLGRLVASAQDAVAAAAEGANFVLLQVSVCVSDQHTPALDCSGHVCKHRAAVLLKWGVSLTLPLVTLHSPHPLTLTPPHILFPDTLHPLTLLPPLTPPTLPSQDASGSLPQASDLSAARSQQRSGNAIPVIAAASSSSSQADTASLAQQAPALSGPADGFCLSLDSLVPAAAAVATGGSGAGGGSPDSSAVAVAVGALLQALTEGHTAGGCVVGG